MENNVKKTITFIILKILEIGSIFGLIIGPYFFGKYVNMKEWIIMDGPNWIIGTLSIFFIFIFIIILVVMIYLTFLLVSLFIRMNWRWACILNETPEEKVKREKTEYKARKQKLENKKRRFFEEHGFWIGDKVKIVDPQIASERKIAGQVREVTDITYFDNIKVKDFDGSFCISQLEIIKKKKKRIKNNVKEGKDAVGGKL